LMVDCSGSMVYSEGLTLDRLVESRKESRLWVASQAACACSLVLDLIGVPHEVLAWTTTGSGKSDSNFERVIPLNHMIVKPAHMAFHSAQKNFIKLALYDYPAENIDGEAVMWGAQRLIQRARHASRQPMLIVFSDGCPQSQPEDTKVLSRHLKETIKRIDQAGVPTIGVGIQTNAVKRYYPKWVVVKRLSDLVSKFYLLLREELRFSKKTRSRN